MRNAVTLLSLVVAVVAEAPYHLPRPAPQAPVFNYAPVPPTLPQPPPNVIAHQHGQHSSLGYNYPRPSRPVVVPYTPAPQPIIVSQPQPIFQQQPAPLPAYQPQPIYQPQPAPQPQPIYQPQPAPQPQPIYHPQPAPQPQPIYQPQPAPQPQPIYHPQPAPQPQPIYQPQPAPQPQPIYTPQPLPIYRPQPAPQPEPIYQPLPSPQPLPAYQPQPSLPVLQPQPIPAQPSPSYGVPQAIRPLSTITVSQPQVQQPIPIQFYQQQSNQGFSYQQSHPIQSNLNSALSSYQADSFQYSNGQQAQSNVDGLDDAVVSRVQSIIKDNEHSTAKERGYLSLVSGVTLENAQPSVEVLSFVQNTPLSTGLSQSSQSLSQSLSQSSSSSSSSSFDVSANIQNDGSESSAFLPQSKPAPIYGVPN